MKRTALLLMVVLSMMLCACSKPAPAPAPDPVEPSADTEPEKTEEIAQDLDGKKEVTVSPVDAKPVEGTEHDYRIADLLGNPVSIRVSTKDYGLDYDHVFKGDELAVLKDILYHSIVQENAEPVKGAGGIGFELVIEYGDSYIKALDANYVFRLGEKEYPYPLECLYSNRDFASSLYQTLGYLLVTGK